MGRSRIGNDDRHNPSKSKLVESALLTLEICRRIGLEHTVPFEKAIELVEDLETQHMLALGLAQMSASTARLCIRNPVCRPAEPDGDSH